MNDNGWILKDNEIYSHEAEQLINCTVGSEFISCNCNNITEECTTCCAPNSCDDCWDNDWQLITMMQVSISILFLLGIIGVVIAFLKLCSRAMQVENSRPLSMTGGLNNDNINMSNPQLAARYCDRPPSYNEIYGTPPSYSAPTNIMSMSDTPPVYSGISQGQERTIRPNAVPLTVIQHI